MKKKLTLNLETVRNLEDSDVNTVVGGLVFSASRIGDSISDSSTITVSTTLPPATDSCPPDSVWCPTPPAPESMFCSSGFTFGNLSETVMVSKALSGGNSFRQR